MSALATANPAPSERRLMGGTLFLLAGLAATNIILPAFPRIGAELAISSEELGLLLSSFFVAFALGQLVVGPLSEALPYSPPGVSFAPWPAICPLWFWVGSFRRWGLARPQSCRAPSHVTSLTARPSAGLWR
jgi:MFS family permease